MKKGTTSLTAAAALAAALIAAAVSADENATLIINGEQELVTRAPAAAHHEYLDEVRSGWTFRTEDTQALQMDDFDNPAMIFVDQAIDTWNTVEGAADESCASCHGDPESLAGFRATTPKWNPEANAVWTAEMYINDCRENRMQAEPWGWNSQEMRNMTALIGLQSRGMPMDVAIDGPVRETWEQGKEIYYTRFGQLELSCANCHEQNYDNYIRADHLSQGMTNGFPVYRLKQANLVSQHNRFRGCIRDTRAETFGVGSPEFIALELYVASRANGLAVETPAVRN